MDNVDWELYYEDWQSELEAQMAEDEWAADQLAYLEALTNEEENVRTLRIRVDRDASATRKQLAHPKHRA